MSNPFEKTPGSKQEWRKCPICGGDGKGADAGTKCPRCKGSGKLPDN